MSRCFPYPPPWYTPSRAKDEALIESIKLQREREKSKDLRKKEKRREKKEKRREKKLKRKAEKEKKGQEVNKSDIVNGCVGDKNWTNTEDEILHKRIQDETEQLERSSLSEEHGEPVCFHASSSSSDSTESSKKRKTHSSPENGMHGNGSSILMHLPSKKLRSTTPEIIESPSQNTHEIHCGDRPENLCCMQQVNSNADQGLTLWTNREQICMAAGQIEAVAPPKIGIQAVPHAASTSMSRRERKYKKLFESWVPPQLQDSYLDDDQDWLLQGKNEVRAGDRKQRSENDNSSCCRSLGLWPRADFLHGVNIQAFPFTIPF